MPGGILLNPSASGSGDCCCGGGKCSTYYCQACGVYLLIDEGSVTDDSGSYAFDSTGTTATAPDGHWYVLDCTSHAPKVALEEHWINDDGDEQVEGSIATPSSCDPLSSSHSYLSTGVTYKCEGCPARWRGIYDDKGRVIAAMTFDSDLGDSWEWADDPQYDEKFSALGIRIGVNYVVYAMTH